MQIQSENVQEIAKALVKAQSVMDRAIKDSPNSYFKSKYADLGSVMDACLHALNSNGISVLQPMDISESGHPMLITTLLHESGQWIKSFALLPFTQPGPQALGSAITYMRRYCLAAIIGVIQEDDDANNAEFITNDQIEELESVIGEDKQYRTKLLKRLALRSPSIKEFKKIPQFLYEEVLKDAVKNKESVISKKLQEPRLINEGQLKFLNGLLECDPTYKAGLIQHLAARGIPSLDKIPFEMVDALTKGAQNHRDNIISKTQNIA